MAATPPSQSQDREPGEALRGVLAIVDEFARAEGLGRLAPGLSEEQMHVAYRAVVELEQPNARALALEGIGPYLSGPLAGDALSQAASLPNDPYRTIILVKLRTDYLTTV